MSTLSSDWLKGHSESAPSLPGPDRDRCNEIVTPVVHRDDHAHKTLAARSLAMSSSKTLSHVRTEAPRDGVLSHEGATLGIQGQSHELGREGVRISSGHQPTRRNRHDLAPARRVRGEDRQPGRHRLEEDVAERVGRGGEDEQVGGE